MNSRQYSQMLANRRVRRPGAVGEGPALDAVLRRAAGQLKQRQQVLRSLERLVEAEYLAQVSVLSFDNGCLTLGTADAVVAERLRRRITTLEKQLAGSVPGLRRLQITRGGPPTAAAAGGSKLP